MDHSDITTDWQARPCVLATMHKKEQIIAPLFSDMLGIDVDVPPNFNSDAFGTFTGDKRRSGNQLEAARLKALAAMDLTNTDLALASEGSFGSHPTVPFLSSNLELVVLVDKKHNLTIIGQYRTSSVRARGQTVYTTDAAVAVALDWGFPQQGVIVRASSLCGQKIYKEIRHLTELHTICSKSLSRRFVSSLVIETDMRAHRCPDRAKSIHQATLNLIHNCLHKCPRCTTPGFVIVDTTNGLPCNTCNRPTDQLQAITYACQKCHYRQIRPATIQTHADSGMCQWCNP